MILQKILPVSLDWIFWRDWAKLRSGEFRRVLGLDGKSFRVKWEELNDFKNYMVIELLYLSLTRDLSLCKHTVYERC